MKSNINFPRKINPPKRCDIMSHSGNVFILNCAILLTTHTTHFIYGYMASDIIMVKDHSDGERRNSLPPHELLLPISSKGSFICRIAHITVFVTPVVEHWLEGVIRGRRGFKL